MIRRCTNCVMPDTKPDLLFSDRGVCSACSAFADRSQVDWHSRREEFQSLVEDYRSDKNWDCIVPVSGGKDSTAQVLKVLELGLRPLCVVAGTCDLTPIGRRNLDNLALLGVDLIEIRANPKIRRQLNKIGLERVGDISWPEHLAIFTSPVRAAVQFNVPLIVWGENSQNEYGGPAASMQNKVLDRKWLEEFGGLLGLRPSDLIAEDAFAEQDLLPYMYPSEAELSSVGVTGLFLGHYFPWDGVGNALIAGAYGFESNPTHTPGSMVGYENLDNFQTGIHEYFKYLKYGFGRTSDHVSLHIRRGRLTRKEGMAIVLMNDGAFPSEYMGQSLEITLGKIGLTVSDFNEIADEFTNEEIFMKDAAGDIRRKFDGTPVQLNYDN